MLEDSFYVVSVLTTPYYIDAYVLSKFNYLKDCD